MAFQDETPVENKATEPSDPDGLQLAQAPAEVIPAPGPGEQVVVEQGEVPCFDIESLEGVTVAPQEGGGLLVTLPGGGEILLLNVAPGAGQSVLCLADGSFVSLGELIEIAGASLADILPALGPEAEHGGGAGFSQPEQVDPEFAIGPEALPPTALGPAPPILEPLVLPAAEDLTPPFAAEFAIKVRDETQTLPSDFDQSATITEENDANDTGTFRFSLDLGGDTLTGGDEASVVVTVGGDAAGGNGTALDADFTQAVITAIITDATAAGIDAADNGDGTVTLTWGTGDPLFFDVDLTSVDDAFPDSPETLTLSLSAPTVTNGSAAIASGMGSADLTITDTEAAEFAIKVRDETETAAAFDQAATITEENDGNDTGTFRFSLSGVTLEAGDTASVVVTMSGTAEDADFTSAVIAAIVAQLPGGVTASAQTATSVTLTWDDTAPLFFDVGLTSVDDAFPDSPETLTLSLGTPLLNGSGTNASVSATMGSADLTITDTEAVEFAIKVRDETETLAVDFDQAATITEENDSNDTGTFRFSLSGVTLQTGDTASVVVTVSGDTENGAGEDFTAAVLTAIELAAEAAGIEVPDADKTATSLKLVWGEGDPLFFDVDLTSVDDELTDSPETLTLSLGTPLLNGSGTNASVSATMGSADLTITDIDVDAEFAIKVRDETETADDFDQAATITEENNDNDTGTFRFSLDLGGDTLTGGNEASVLVTMSGTAEDADFTAAVIAEIVAQLPSGVTASAQTATSVTLTWDDTAPLSFEIDLTSFDDAFPDSFETLTLSLSAPTVTNGSAVIASGMGSADLTITDTDSPINVLDGPFVTNTNQLDQKAILTFVSLTQPINAFSKWFLMDEQGQEGNIAEDAGFDINPLGDFAFSMENDVSNTTKIIVTDLTLEGVVIQDGGNTQISPDGSQGSGGSGGKPFAFTSVFSPDDAPTPDQGVTDSTDGTDGNDTGGSSIADPSVSDINFLYGWEGDDTLNGGAGMDFLHGGEGSDVLNGGDGNDLLVFDGLDTAIDGGAGADILRVDGDGLADSTVSLTGKPITNIEVILLTEDAAGVDGVGSDTVGIELVLDEADVLAFTDGNNTLYVVGTLGDSIDDLNGGWTDTGIDQNINGAIFDKFTAAGGATLFVDQDVDSSGLLAVTP